MNIHASDLPLPKQPETENTSGSGIAEQSTWKDEVPTSHRFPVFWGIVIILVFFVGCGVLAVFAPIRGAIVSSGFVQASGQNQIIEHYDGGIISSINVSEGDRVNKNDVLIVLDKTRMIAERNRVLSALLQNEARYQRALAERDGKDIFSLPPRLEKNARIFGLDGDIHHQEVEFSNRLRRHKSQISAINKRINALREEIVGLKDQQAAENAKLDIIREEMSDKKGLLEQGLTPKSHFDSLRRAEADSVGRIGSLKATVAQREFTIAEMEEERTSRESSRLEEASGQVNEINTTLSDLREQLSARNDSLERSEIRAPVDGIVVALEENTVGGVVQTGQKLLEILPSAEKLIIEAKISPTDVDSIFLGQESFLRFSALNARTTPEVKAILTYVSADRLINPDNGEPYYTARLKLDDGIGEIMDVKQIQPGMPVEVFIKTDERTFVEYLVRPMLDSFAKAFREE